MRAAVLHNQVLRIWYQKSLLALLLLPFSLVYWLLSALRRAAYTAGLLGRPELPVPVVIVGNITAGGTGKTPVVVWLARQLAQQGFQPAVVSRGYGGRNAAEPVLVGSASTAEQVGDEAILLKRLTGCPVVVCPDRVAAVKLAAQQGANIILSDDGLQHYRLRRSVEIAVIDASRGVGNGWLMPAGPLRERAQRLQEVDVVLVNGAGSAFSGIEFQLQQGDAVSLVDGARRTVEDVADEVWSVAGIGNPQRFHESLRGRGLTVHEVDVPDHGKTSLSALRAKRDIPIIMTEKDATKYRTEEAASAWYVPVSLTMSDENAAELMALITQRCNLKLNE